MEEQRISFKTAKLAKKKGFDTIQWYGMEASLYKKNGEHTYYANYGVMYSGLSDGYISAPTQSLLAKWLREVHNYHIEIHLIPICPTYNFAIMWIFNGVQCKIGSGYKSYEEALEAGLIETLNLIKK